MAFWCTADIWKGILNLNLNLQQFQQLSGWCNNVINKMLFSSLHIYQQGYRASTAQEFNIKPDLLHKTKRHILQRPGETVTQGHETTFAHAYHDHRFIVLFSCQHVGARWGNSFLNSRNIMCAHTFLFISCIWLFWLHISQLLHFTWSQVAASLLSSYAT